MKTFRLYVLVFFKGAGIFITPTSVLRVTQSVGLNLVVWGLGGVISLFGSFTFAELACRVPKHGCRYAYLKEAFGSWLAFVYTWTSILLLTPSALAVVCLTFSRYFMTMVRMCGTPELPVTLVAVTLIVTLCVVNMTSSILSVRINEVFLYAKVLALIIIIVGGFVVIIRGGHPDSELTSGFAGTTDSPASIAKSFYFVMWTYGGWDSSNTIVEEVKNPSRNVPLAAIVGVVAVTVIYVLTNVSYLAVMSPQQMLAADTVAVTWGNAVLGTGLASLIIPLCVMTSTAGSANGSMFVEPRMIFSAARDGNFPEAFSYLQVHSRIPLLSVFLIIALAIFYAVFSDIMELITMAEFTAWFFNFLIAASLLLIRHRQPRDQYVAFKQPLPGVIFFMLSSLFLMVVPLTEGIDTSLYFSITVYCIAVIIFFAFKFLKDRTHCCGQFSLFLSVFPSSLCF
ncbi:hypothetical protein ACOMHN_013529 [Nucella lapillus]